MIVISSIGSNVPSISQTQHRSWTLFNNLDRFEHSWPFGSSIVEVQVTLDQIRTSEGEGTNREQRFQEPFTNNIMMESRGGS